MDTVPASKRLAFLLRHRPEQAGLVVNDEGWTSVPAVLDATALTLQELEQVVRDNDKNRFEWDRGAQRIRARQGHSFPVDLSLKPIVPPAVLYHGTTQSAADAIGRDGLRPMARQHVHLSLDEALAREVALRHGHDVVIFVVDARALTEAGHSVYLSTNGVYLADGVPAQFIATMEIR